MSYMVKFDESPVPGLSLPITSAAGSREDMRQLSDDAFFERVAIRFAITDADGNEAVTGSFNGADQDRDVPLMIARIHARGKADLATINYEDGVTYVINEAWGFAVKKD